MVFYLNSMISKRKNITNTCVFPVHFRIYCCPTCRDCTLVINKVNGGYFRTTDLVTGKGRLDRYNVHVKGFKFQLLGQRQTMLMLNSKCKTILI